MSQGFSICQEAKCRDYFKNTGIFVEWRIVLCYLERKNSWNPVTSNGSRCIIITKGHERGPLTATSLFLVRHRQTDRSFSVFLVRRKQNIKKKKHGSICTSWQQVWRRVPRRAASCKNKLSGFPYYYTIFWYNIGHGGSLERYPSSSLWTSFGMVRYLRI